MFEITCLDSNSNSIDRFTQWDRNQKITAMFNYEDEYLHFKIHFDNKNMTEALVVTPEVKDENGKITATADVPNELLMESYPLNVYICVYYIDGDSTGETEETTDTEESKASRRVILQAEIPVRKRAKPSDYIYVKNVDVTTFEDIVIDVVRRLRLISTNDGNGNITTVIGGV